LDGTSSPILFAIAREEARLRVQTPRMIVDPQPILTDGSRIRGLRKGTEILLSPSDAPRGKRFVLGVTDTELLVSKLTASGLPPAARIALSYS
jgi:hypothetical protein